MCRAFAIAAAVALLCLGMVAHASGVSVYANNFDGAIGPEWSYSTTEVTPVGARRFLGQFTNETVSLSLDGLAFHDTATVSFDLFVIRSWDGNYNLPDNPLNVWSLSVAGGSSLISTTFALYTYASEQSYPGNYPDGHYAPRTGASENNTLGYTFTNDAVHNVPMDAVYRMSFTFPHTSTQLTLDFAGTGLQGLDYWVADPYLDESWGLDNVAVSANAVPEPSSIIALLGGLISLLGMRWRRASPLPRSNACRGIDFSRADKCTK